MFLVLMFLFKRSGNMVNIYSHLPDSYKNKKQKPTKSEEQHYTVPYVLFIKRKTISSAQVRNKSGTQNNHNIPDYPK